MNTQQIGARMRQLVGIALQDKDFEAAQTFAHTWTVAEPDSANAWHALAIAYAKQKRFGETRRCLNAVLAREPKRIAAWVDSAEACIAQMDYYSAAQALRHAMELDPHGDDPAGRRARAVTGRTLMKLRSLNPNS